MNEPPAGWSPADAWVFAAIAVYGRPCSLLELVASGDLIGHAILAEDELEAAFGRLTGAGLVRVYEAWTFELTEDGTSLWSGADRDLAGLLHVIAEQLADFEPGRSSVRLPRGALDQAVQEYRRVGRSE